MEQRSAAGRVPDALRDDKNPDVRHVRCSVWLCHREAANELLHAFDGSRRRLGAPPCVVRSRDSRNHDNAAGCGADLKVLDIEDCGSHRVINGCREPAGVVELAADVIRDR